MGALSNLYSRVTATHVDLPTPKPALPVAKPKAVEGLPGRDVFGNIISVERPTQTGEMATIPASEVSKFLATQQREQYAASQSRPGISPTGDVISPTMATESASLFRKPTGELKSMAELAGQPVSKEYIQQSYMQMPKTPEEQKTEQTLKKMTDYFDTWTPTAVKIDKYLGPVAAAGTALVEPIPKLMSVIGLGGKGIPVVGDLFKGVSKDANGIWQVDKQGPTIDKVLSGMGQLMAEHPIGSQIGSLAQWIVPGMKPLAYTGIAADAINGTKQIVNAKDTKDLQEGTIKILGSLATVALAGKGGGEIENFTMKMLNSIPKADANWVSRFLVRQIAGIPMDLGFTGGSIAASEGRLPTLGELGQGVVSGQILRGGMRALSPIRTVKELATPTSELIKAHEATRLPPEGPQGPGGGAGGALETLVGEHTPQVKPMTEADLHTKYGEIAKKNENVNDIMTDTRYDPATRDKKITTLYKDPMVDGFLNQRYYKDVIPESVKSEKGNVIFIDVANMGEANNKLGEKFVDDMLGEIGRHFDPKQFDSRITAVRNGGDEISLLNIPDAIVPEVKAKVLELKKSWDASRESFTGKDKHTGKMAELKNELRLVFTDKGMNHASLEMGKIKEAAKGKVRDYGATSGFEDVPLTGGKKNVKMVSQRGGINENVRLGQKTKGNAGERLAGIQNAKKNAAGEQAGLGKAPAPKRETKGTAGRVNKGAEPRIVKETVVKKQAIPTKGKAVSEFKVKSINEKTGKPDGNEYNVKFRTSKSGKQSVEKYITGSDVPAEIISLEKARSKYQSNDLNVIAERMVNPQTDWNYKTDSYNKPVSDAEKYLAKRTTKFRTSTEQDKTELTTRIIKDLGDRETVSKQFISDLTNRGDIKQAEKDIIRDVLSRQPSDKIDVKQFKADVQAELLPLTVKSSVVEKKGGLSYPKTEGYAPKYESIALPDNERGNVANYAEHIYESPIQTSAGDVHFGWLTKNYFGHTRIEDMRTPYNPNMPEGKHFSDTRRVIEVQSDLYQKGGISRELISGGLGEKKTPKQWDKESRLLQQYNDPTAHFRMVREEVARAAADGKTKLQFPTGEAAMKIEGLGRTSEFTYRKRLGDPASSTDTKLTVDNMKKGMIIDGNASDWMIVDTLGNGKMKVINIEEYDYDILRRIKKDILDGKFREGGYNIETIDISGKMDTNNPIYKFYEKDLGRYLKSKYDAKTIVDDKGVTWNQVDIKPEMAGPVEAFRVKDDMAKVGIKISDTQEKQIIDLNKKIFGDENIKITEQILTPEGQKALGSYKERMIKILKGQAKAVDTYYHEAVHKYFDVFTTKDEQISLLIEAKKKYKTDSFEKAEEALAESFIKYAKSRSGITGKIKTIFDSVLNRIKLYTGNENKIKKFYDDMLAGKAKKQALPMKETNLTTGTGISKHYEKFNKGFEEYNDSVEYGKINIKNEGKKAIDWATKNPREALRVAYGMDKAPDGIRDEAVGIIMKQHLSDIGKKDLANTIRQKTSLKFTEEAQGLNIAKLDKDSIANTAINQIYSDRLKKLAGNKKTFESGETSETVARKKIKEQAKEESATISKETIKKQSAQDILDMLTCK